MAPLKLTQIIDAPVDRVFALATDLPRAAEHIDGIDKIEMLTDGPVSVGTRWRETRGKMGTEELEITRFDPPHGYTAECDTCGCHFVSTFRFTPVGAGAEAQLEMTTQPRTLLAKLMSPLVGLMMRSATKAIRQDLLDIKRVAESQDNAC